MGVYQPVRIFRSLLFILYNIRIGIENKLKIFITVDLKIRTRKQTDIIFYR